MKRFIYVPFIVAAISILASCGSKDKKRALIEDIEHFKVDTIVQSPEEAKDYPSMYEVLRRYPELFKSAAHAEKEYDKWAEKEQEMITEALSDKDGKVKENGDKGIKALDFRKALSDALTDNSVSGETTAFIDNKVILDEYVKIMFSEDENAEELDDEVKSSVGRARKRWEEYFKKVEKLSHEVPEEYRAQFIYLFNEQCKRHLADLQSRYRNPNKTNH